jgi:3-mercaptopyruvate sulfurtransferase SseA
MAVGILERNGFKTVRNLKGGSRAWIDAGLPVYEAVQPDIEVKQNISKTGAEPTDSKKPPVKKSRRPPEIDAGC